MVILLLKEQSSRDGIGGPGKLCNQRIAANLESYPTINFYGFGKLIERCLNAAVCKGPPLNWSTVYFSKRRINSMGEDQNRRPLTPCGLVFML
jgi:hypothetical protein